MIDFMIDFKQYSIIGDPIQHSISPFLHKIIFEYLGISDEIYSRLRITSDGLVYNFSLLKSNFRGFNVTAPHKCNIIKYLDDLDEFPKKFGSVNTVKIVKGNSFGYNTDFYGFLKGLGDFKDKINGKSILVIGNGATARVVINVLIDLGASVVVCARNFEKLVGLKQIIHDTCSGYDIDIVSLEKLKGDYFGIVNATSYKELEINSVNVSDFAYDLNYATEGLTQFLYNFFDRGINVIDGIDMLFHQAIKSQEIWKDMTFEEEDINNIYVKFKSIFRSNS